MLHELTGRILGLSEDYTTGKALMTIEINEKSTAKAVFNEFNDTTKLSVKVSKYREKRSLNANSYCWALCSLLSEKMSSSKVKYTKEDIYKNAIKELNIYRDFTLPPQEAYTLQKAWEMLGTGWVTEQVDYSEDGSNVVIRCYYGSSQYNTKQMSRLIDNLVQDCRAVGIETMPQNEIDSLCMEWEYEKTNKSA